MGSNGDREIEGETTRVEAVEYLQGARGHATGSLLFLFAGAVAWAGGYPVYGWVLVVPAVLVSANGFSIWAWTRLVAHFTARAEGSEDEATRTLRANPLSTESAVEMKAGGVMTLAFLAVLLVVRLGLAVLEPQEVAALCVACLAVGNVVALAWSLHER